MTTLLEVVKQACKETHFMEKPQEAFLSNTILVDEIDQMCVKTLKQGRASVIHKTALWLLAATPAGMNCCQGYVSKREESSSLPDGKLDLRQILENLSIHQEAEHLFYEDVEDGRRIHVYKVKLDSQFRTGIPFVHINDIPDSYMESGKVEVRRDEDIVYLVSWVNRLPKSDEDFEETKAEWMEEYNSILVHVDEDTEQVTNWVAGKFQPTPSEYWGRNPRKRDLRSQYVWFRVANREEAENE